ncbi:MAG: hypothetical protein K6G12_02995 [Lachnospiraceae bacterium]|nr:hypothetical protein [Lachnospiraceae bacterium]
MIEYDRFLNQILNGYRTNYDVSVHDDGDDLVATAESHVRQGQHVVFKEFEMWSANDDEYVYVFRIPHLTAELVQNAISRAYDDGFPKIKLDHVDFKHQHMCTRLVALFLFDDADEDALTAIRKCKIYKSFQFSLKGWMEMHTAGICLADERVISNRYGRETAKFLKMHAKHYAKHVESIN